MADLGASDQARSISDAGQPPASGPEPLRGARRVLWGLLYLVPKNALSRLVGRLAGIAWPGALQRGQIRLFARATGIDLSEARDSIETFGTLQEFFTRALAEGTRPVEGDASCLVSPCDGAWGASGRIESGTLVQAKGREYSVAEFLGDAELASRYEGGSFATLYLSPRDYHRFHTPTAGRFVRLDYHPGALWPVNSIGLQGIDRLFARNERVVALLTPDAWKSAAPERAPLALVAVGATIVGGIRVTFDEVRTNRRGAEARRREFGDRAPHFERGREWGHFEFGSTIVLLVPPGSVEVEFQPVGSPVRLGQRIGQIGS